LRGSVHDSPTPVAGNCYFLRWLSGECGVANLIPQALEPALSPSLLRQYNFDRFLLVKRVKKISLQNICRNMIANDALGDQASRSLGWKHSRSDYRARNAGY
jgi:hypothetical protein